MKKIIHASIFILTYVFSLAVYAENNSYLMLEASNDNADGKNYYLGTGVDFIGASQLNLSYGKSDSTTVKTSNYAVGVTSDPAAKFSVGFTYLYWEQKSAMQTRSYQLSLTNNTDDWRFSLTPELRVITIYPLTAPAVDINSTGLGFNAAYYGAFPWFVSAGIKLYAYERNVGVLNTNQYPMFTMRNFSSATLDQASGLEDNRINLDAGYAFTRFTLGYYYDRSLSAVDDSSYTSHSVYGKYNVNEHWQLGAEAGRSKSSLNAADTTSFTRASISYNW